MKKFPVVMLVVIMLISMFSVSYASETPEVISGVLPNGVSYTITPMTDEEIVEYESQRAMENSLLRSVNWSGSVKVPVMNSSGSNGANVGPSFYAFPDAGIVRVVVGSIGVMPSVNIGVNLVSNGSNLSWIPQVGAYRTVDLNIGPYTQSLTQVKTSTNGSISDWADFTIYTSL